MRVLVTGGNGLLGSYLVRSFASRHHDVVATWHSREPVAGPGIRWVRLMLEERDRLHTLLEKEAPEVVVHTAAMTNVDACQMEPDASWRLNVLAAEALAQGARRVGARVVFYSTDYVFDGRAGHYSERDSPNPINVHGSHKWEAEQRVQSARPDALILRVSVVYGVHPVRVDFVRWLRQGWGEGKVRRVVTDQSNSPTYAGFAAETTRSLVERDATGTFHVTGRGGLSRFDFARLVAQVFGQDPRLLEPMLSRDLPQAAPRPRDASLSNEKLAQTLGGPIPDHRALLETLRRELGPGA